MNEKDTALNPAGSDQPLFSQDPDIQHVYKKTETITGAIFLVTNLIPDTDILKKTIREQALAVLAQAVSLANNAANVVMLDELAAKFSHVHSLLDIAFWSGLISQMNSSLLQKEITATQKTIFTVTNRYKTKFYIDQDFFMSQPLPLPATARPEAKPVQAEQYKGQDKRQNIKDNIVMSDTEVRPIVQPRERIEKTGEKNERKDAIVSFLKNKPAAGIKDFSAVLPGVSEKTIQRELAALVAEGVLKKQGERRWSTYSLA